MTKLNTHTHTPAPWKLAGATTISNAEQTACIAHVSTFSIEQSEADANAALIASAPDLLAALQAIIEEAGEGFGEPDSKGRVTGTINRMAFFARQAIAKAEGVI